MWKIFSRIKVGCLFTNLQIRTYDCSPTGFDIAFTNVENTLMQRQDKVVLTLFQRCFNVGQRRCINVVQLWRSDARFCFIFNLGSTLFQRWSTTLKHNVETTLIRRLFIVNIHLFRNNNLAPSAFFCYKRRRRSCRNNYFKYSSLLS